MWQKITKILKSSYTTIFVIVIIVIFSLISYYVISFGKEFLSFATSESYSDTSSTETTPVTEDCNVSGISIHGAIVTYNGNNAYNDQDKLILDQTASDGIQWAVKQANDNEKIKAIVVEIDSYGGSAVAGEEIMRDFKDSKKPVVAFIRDVGVSAGYMAATGAETIFASRFSTVGSIGVTQSYLQNADKNTKEGLTYIDLASGPYKDSGNPDKPLTEAEKQLFMRDINIMYNDFINIVAKNRNLSVDKVKALADGSTVMGEAALKAGLIDKIGLYPDVINFLSEKIGAPVTVCWQN